MADFKRVGVIAKQIVNNVRAKQGFSVDSECPDCFSIGPHETNGDHLDPSAVCKDCGMVFDIKNPVFTTY